MPCSSSSSAAAAALCSSALQQAAHLRGGHRLHELPEHVVAQAVIEEQVCKRRAGSRKEFS